MITQVEKKENTTVKWLLAILIVLLVVAGCYQKLFTFAAFALFLAAAVFLPQSDALFILVFLFSFASIFKPVPNQQSFFTYGMVFYVLIFALRSGKINKQFLAAFLILAAYFMMQMVVSVNLLRIIKFLTNVLVAYFGCQVMKDKDCSELFKGFVVGICLSSALVCLNLIPNLTLYLRTKETLIDGSYSARFAGLYADPNYYSINLIIGMCLLEVLFYRKKIKTPVFLVLMLCMAYFAVLTYSKSAFLMLAFPAVFFLYINWKKRKFWLLFFALCGLTALVVGILSKRIDLFAKVLTRFEEGQENGDITTGRYNLWLMYLRHFAKLNLQLFVGNGFEITLLGGHAPHNTYIDMVFCLGVFGAAALLTTLAAIFKIAKKPIKRNFLNYSVLIVVCVMYAFLSMLFYFDIAFHILMAILAMNVDLHPEQGLVQTEA